MKTLTLDTGEKREILGCSGNRWGDMEGSYAIYVRPIPPKEKSLEDELLMEMGKVAPGRGINTETALLCMVLDARLKELEGRIK